MVSSGYPTRLLAIERLARLTHHLIQLAPLLGAETEEANERTMGK